MSNNSIFLPIEWSLIINWYRNKTEFSFWKYISAKSNIEEHFNLGFHKPWDFSKVEDFEGSPLIDEIQNEIFREIKKFTKTLWLPVYDQMKQEWFFKHLMIRKAYFTEEIMILLSFNPDYFKKNTKLSQDKKLSLIKDFFFKLAEKYKIIKSIYFSRNVNKADTVIWDLELVYGEKTIKEKLHWLIFNIFPTSFFQTNSAWAEKLYEIVLEFAINMKENITMQKSLISDWLLHQKQRWHKNIKQLKGLVVLDLYSWTWTIWMIFAKYWAKKVISVESETSASKDWEENAKLNGLKNIEFVNDKVENYLDTDYWYLNDSAHKLDLIVIDPPRAGMHPKAVEDILKFNAKQIIYVSCNPATLVRDLKYIYENSDYKIEKVKPMDMFPHTHHIETIVSLIK